MERKKREIKGKKRKLKGRLKGKVFEYVLKI